MAACPEGTLANSENVCDFCFKLCATCDEASNEKACLSCIEGYLLIEKECFKKIELNPNMAAKGLKSYTLVFNSAW